MDSLSIFYLFIAVVGVAITGLIIFYLIHTAKKTMEDDMESSESHQPKNKK